ncbi:ribulose-1,5 bisphosphate carboxylase/oxygenase large subunit N-methyltransferase, chloroplastic isoform X2 [Telopea speciosissima]|uniref:ribulose-1,5 bisphosphate carboxylase/oxygenase large subunit N-methyltransferase, chloroplastic isoform X2 n=1 Tax=Telopea speciosissima TaxID=54955 RepID=UPI001CC770B8|nr:ribulose-1,5 bisphosphate carboxylase/oxygenase large subunit N-methyltransferase, chloroplastic isoform X2 [Telopea speciosissima]
MWAVSRLTNLWIHGTFLFQFSRLHFRLKCVSSCSKAVPCLSEDCDEFLPWLERKAGVEISSLLSIGKSGHGRSLLASKFIRAGDCILKVPFSVITPDKILPEISWLLGDDVGYTARLAIFILVEKKMGQDSRWVPYISRLPRPGELHCTIFWSEDELDMVRKSAIYHETVNQQAQLEKEFLAIRPVLDHFPQIFEDVTLKDFMHAYALVGSRAWGSSKGLSLIPFADFLNHDGFSEAVLLSDEHKQISEVIADRDYAPGEEVLIRYGKFPNTTLLQDFGFTLPYNVHDQVQIWVGVPQHDPLRMMKLDLLRKHCAQTVTNTDGFDSFKTNFTIKEVRSASRKGKGIPQPLRAFARVLSTTSVEELEDLVSEAAQNDGRLARRPLQNESREIQAHQFLLSQISQLIQEYEVSIKSLNTDKPTSVGRLTIRAQMAQDLLAGELRVLKSASTWLKNYCATLSTAEDQS